MTTLEEKTLAERTKALSEDELDVVVDNIPVEACVNRMLREIEKNREFIKAIQDAFKLLED